MGGKPSRDKGARSERELVKILRENGLDAVRVPLSGACEGFKGDVIVSLPHKFNGCCGSDYADCSRCDRTFHQEEFIRTSCDMGQLRIESKVRANGFKQIYAWLEGNDALAIKADRKEWLIVVPLAEWVKR